MKLFNKNVTSNRDHGGNWQQEECNYTNWRHSWSPQLAHLCRGTRSWTYSQPCCLLEGTFSLGATMPDPAQTTHERFSEVLSRTHWNSFYHTTMGRHLLSSDRKKTMTEITQWVGRQQRGRWQRLPEGRRRQGRRNRRTGTDTAKWEFITKSAVDWATREATGSVQSLTKVSSVPRALVSKLVNWGEKGPQFRALEEALHGKTEQHE